MVSKISKKKLFLSLLLAFTLLFSLLPTSVLAANAQTIKLPKTASVQVGKTTTLKPTLTPNKSIKITWKSNKTSVATVNSKGVVKGVKAGTAVITAKLPNNKYAKCTVTVKPKMSVSSSGIKNGVIADKYGMRGTMDAGGVPTVSLPLTVKNAPSATKCYAVYMRDPDSVPLAGFAWNHWMAANIKSGTIAENASVKSASQMVQGRNDFGTIGYGGPTPPNAPHQYVMTVYALDQNVKLSKGFSYSQFQAAIKGHVLAEATIKGTYSN